MFFIRSLSVCELSKLSMKMINAMVISLLNCVCICKIIYKKLSSTYPIHHRTFDLKHLLNTGKTCLIQSSSYLNSPNLYNTCQSAYRPGRSTEKTLMKVVNDLFLSLYKGYISVLALVDFSSVNDAIDHPTLYTLSILTLDLLILSFNGFHLI